MEIDAIGGLGISTGESSSNSADGLQSTFLQLMITQMRHQDPFNPMDNEAMISQLATFSELEQLQQLNQRMTANMAATEALNGVLTETANTTMMLSLPGRRVTVLGDGVELVDGEASRSVIRVAAAGRYEGVVKDEDGNVVRELEAGVLEPGFNDIAWDGLDDDGEGLPDGKYTLEITAYDREGDEASFALFMSGEVETVQFDAGGTWVIIDGKRYSIGEIVEVGIQNE